MISAARVAKDDDVHSTKLNLLCLLKKLIPTNVRR
ncbi:hypothetical protein Q31b_51110 [Novipirellula aureliae]|uniref:Uncharacterized protein n=1 Tax=Novipirellula aureliae TaxID=2527966 RepID=A0A5C6DL82_9BACT|nr:hypothetical protein Q31b_51110 [Novipirellula aureliae]